MYGILASGMGNWPIIRELAIVMGWIMNGIYEFMSTIFHVENIGVCIIIFTIIVFTLMIPFTIKQQKWTKLTAVIQPEVQKVQQKYKGKTDQASQLKMQEETQAIYDKYGTSMTAGCLPMFIQMPFLFALYPVIQNIPKYVSGVKEIYMPLVDQIMAVDGFQKIMEKIGEASPVLMQPSAFDYSKADTLVQVLYRFQDSTWETLVDKIPSLEGAIETTTAALSPINNFLGLNIAETPWSMLQEAMHPMSILGIIAGLSIPILAGASQFISSKLMTAMQNTNQNKKSNDPMANSMKSMTYTMPLMSVFFCFTLPAGLGLYLIASAVVRCVQQIFINMHLNKMSVEQIIEENKEKAEKKAKKRKEVTAENLNRIATTNTRNVEKSFVMSEKEKEEKLEKAAEYRSHAKKGSMTDIANMVNRYNSGQSEDE